MSSGWSFDYDHLILGFAVTTFQSTSVTSGRFRLFRTILVPVSSLWGVSGVESFYLVWLLYICFEFVWIGFFCNMVRNCLVSTSRLLNWRRILFYTVESFLLLSVEDVAKLVLQVVYKILITCTFLRSFSSVISSLFYKLSSSGSPLGFLS